MLALVLAQGLQQHNSIPAKKVTREHDIYLCPALGPPVQDILPVLIHLELDDGDLAGVDAHVGGGAVCLLPLDPLDVDPGGRNRVRHVWGSRADFHPIIKVTLSDKTAG